LAVFSAISARRSAVIFSARAFPPRRPMDTAAASLPSSVLMISSISGVAIFATLIADPIASAGRFSPSGPYSIAAANEIANFVWGKYPVSDLDPRRFALLQSRKYFQQVAKSMPNLWTAMRLLVFRQDEIVISRGLTYWEPNQNGWFFHGQLVFH
jgi:hypothetical protein